MIKELTALCLATLDDGDAQWAIKFWNTLPEQELFEELAEARASFQMAQAEGRWEDGGCNFLSN